MICTLILLDGYISPVNNSINNTQTTNFSNISYLDHNITIQKNQTEYFNNENIEFFGKNISILDYGTLDITNSKLNSMNFTVTINVYGGRINVINSSIDAPGHLNIIGSNATFISSVINKNSNMTLYFQKDNVIFDHSYIGFYSNKVKSKCYTSGIMYGKSYPYSHYGYLPLTPYVFYSNSYVGKLVLKLLLRGDNHGTGEIELYEHSKFIENVSIPVREGNYSYNTTINLPEDIKSLTIGNTQNLAFKIPENSRQAIAGEDGNITFYNITIVALSNDTENYFGVNNYNIVICNSFVNSYNSDVDTNMKNYYIYQKILNPNKKSIFLINSTYNSFNSLYNGSTYKNSPFLNINSSVYYYETINIEFTNGIHIIPLHYNILPDNYNKSLNQIAIICNKNIENDSKLIQYRPSYLFEIQNNNSMKYYGDYQLTSGKFQYNFSIPPIPIFKQNYKAEIYVKIPGINCSLYEPIQLASGKINELLLNITSELHSSIVKVRVIFSNSIIYNHTLSLNANETVSIPINIDSKNNAELRYNISYKTTLYNYSINKRKILFLEFTPQKTILHKYVLTIDSSQTTWELVIGNETINEKGKSAVIVLPSGYYNITINKSGYKSKSISINLNENSTVYISLQKIHTPASTDNLYMIFYWIAGFIILSLFILFIYSKKTVTCSNCRTKYYASYNQCPVCLKPKKNIFDRKFKK